MVHVPCIPPDTNRLALFGVCDSLCNLSSTEQMTVNLELETEDDNGEFSLSSEGFQRMDRNFAQHGSISQLLLLLLSTLVKAFTSYRWCYHR